MSLPFDTDSGEQLYGLLPEVYRTRDNGDLAAYLDACGELLDLVRQTLDQRLSDCFPDPAARGREVQEWLLPYFAQLLNVRLVSPDADGKREEVANAVGWRQRKGTRAVVDQIAEAVAQTRVEVHEGWKRVAVTPRPGFPLEPSAGVLPPVDSDDPLAAARNPRLPAVTPDVRFCLGMPGSHVDRTRRTVDVRVPDWKAGHFHPRRAILFAPPPLGFFTPDAVEVPAEALAGDDETIGTFTDPETGLDWVVNLDPRWLGQQPREQGRAVTVGPAADPLAPTFVGNIGILELSFADTLRIELEPGGRVVLEGVAAAKLEVVLEGASAQPEETLGEGAEEGVEDGGESAAGDTVLDLRHCLFGEIEAPDAVARLEYTTVLGRLAAQRVLVSDCLLVGEVAIGDMEGQPASCIRFSRIPLALLRAAQSSELAVPAVTWLRRSAITTDRPAFYDLAGPATQGVGDSPELGCPGCGVLHPATPESICFGAEDGGEMGAYHRDRHCLQRAAVLEKLKDFLPVGIDAALVPDPCLLAESARTKSP